MSRSSELRFDISFYNDEHRAILMRHKYAARIKQLVDSGLSVKEKEFQVYAMFTEQDGRPRFRNYSELKRKVPGRIKLLKDYIDTKNGTVRSLVQPGKNQVTEKVGVASALLVMNKVFGLHRADWERIPKTSKRKTMDFQLASDGNEFILVEAKGTAFETGNLHRDADLERHIKEKKKAHLAENANLTSLFGVITGIPCELEKTAQCLLLDPLFENIRMDAAKYQLLARLYFYSRILRVISRGQLVRALLNRIAVLKRASNYTEFDKLPLVDIYGEPIAPPPENTSSIWNKTIVKDKIIGQMFPVSKTDFVYYALDIDIYRLMVEQNFEAIRKFSSTLDEQFIENVTYDNAIVDIQDLQEYGIPYESFEKFDEANKVIIALTGSVNYSLSGQVIGFFRLPERTLL